MLTPGRIYVGDTKRIAINYQDDDGADIDPDGVTFKLRAPDGTTVSYVYGTNVEIVKMNTGDYYIDVTPTASGRWHWRWVSTGSNKATAHEGTLVVQASAIEEVGGSTAYTG